MTRKFFTIDLFQKSSQKHFSSRLSQTDESRMSDFSAEKYATARKVVSRKTFERILILLAVLVVSPGIFFTSLTFARNSAQEIVFPVAELGSCEDKAECFVYCEIPENSKACLNFAKEYQLLSKEEIRVVEKMMEVSGGPGGCDSKVACESYCDDVARIDECISFAEENGLMEDKDLEEAKKVRAVIQSGGKLPGDCKNKTACENYCQSSEHIEECLAFAETSGFLSPEELEQAKKFMPLMKSGQTPGKCKSKDECEAYCELDEHFDECILFAEKNGMIEEEDRQNIEAFKKSGGRGPGGCKGRQCEVFCKDTNNQQTCFEWAKENGLIDEDDLRDIEGSMRERLPAGEADGSRRVERGEAEGNFSGPGGCKSEEECMNYCQNNPLECKKFVPPQGEQREMDQGMNRGGEEEIEFKDRQYFRPESSEFFPDAPNSYKREFKGEYDRQYEDEYREQYQNQFRGQYEGELRQQFQERSEDLFEYHPESLEEYISPQSRKSFSNLLGFTLDAFTELLK